MLFKRRWARTAPSGASRPTQEKTILISSEVRPVNYRTLMKSVEHLVDTMDRAEDERATIHQVLESIILTFRDELGIVGGRLYRRRSSSYDLEGTFGAAKPVPEGLHVPMSYPPIAIVIEDGTVYMDGGDPRLDKQIEELLGVDRFAAIEVGDEQYILAFDVLPGSNRDDVLISLGILRHSINQKIRRDRMQNIFDEARKIQTSILPKRAPTYGEFDLNGRSDPMESVGGDFFDYIPITDKILGLTIADVSGHGLPAALQVRDIYMGLRMGLARDFKIVRTVERMNRIIHRSTLTSRFVSLFYGELELNGVFIYVNAGHPPPFYLSAAGEVSWLESGGPVLGPLAEASYERGFVVMKPGDLLVFYTDGIVETRGRATPHGPLEEYGVDRLVETTRAVRGRGAQQIVQRIFESVEEFGGEMPAADDRTAMVVSYPADLKSTAAFPRPKNV
jgi:serine phosphatase RsbU (regulator of sigma subunit)